jgi:hypothetical protein
MHDQSFRELLDNVCKRPGMFVGRHDFDLAATFLRGYDWALRNLSTDVRDSGFSGFREWLAVRLDSCVRSFWSEIIRREDTGPDKFEALARLYEEFWQDRKTRGLAAILADFEQLQVADRRGLRNRTCWCQRPIEERDR